MKIIADSFFSIGRAHQVCEDYCISGELPSPHVILSDGCSSSENTDVGARLLVHAMENRLGWCFDWETGRQESFAAFFADSLCDPLGLKRETIDATLGYLYVQDEFIYSKIFGDGVVITGIKEHETKGTLLTYDHITYDYEMPYYLSYLLDKDRDSKYKEINPKKQIQHVSYYRHGEVLEEGQSGSNFSELYSARTCLTRIKFEMIASDGLDSFKNIKTGEDIPLQEIVKRFTNFKVANGEFVKRTARKALKDLAKEDIYPMDDISMGCLLVKREEGDGSLS